MKKTLLPSSDIALYSRPLLHPLLTNVRLDLDYDKLISIIQDSDFLSSNSITKKYGDTLHFDERVGLTGWKGSRSEDENAKTKLKGKAAVEIDDDNGWKEHVIDYSGVNNNGIRCIDIGIALYREERGTNTVKKTNRSVSSSSSDESQNNRKRLKSHKKVISGFRAPKALLLNILSPVQHYKNEGRNKVRSTLTLGLVEVNFEPYILDAYNSDTNVSCDIETVDDMSSISMDSNDKKKITDDDDLVSHIYESIRHIVAYNILLNEKGRFNMYKELIGKKSCIYVTTKKLLTPTRIDNTKELVSFIKETAKKESNWKDQSTLEFRMALGARRDNDPVCIKDDFRAMGVLLDAEEAFSQEVLDEPFDFYNGKTTSTASKLRPVQIETFLDGLYNDDSSQLYHGFTNEMKVVIRNSFMCDKEFYNSVIASNGSFPMEEIAYQRLISYVTTARQFTDLHPERNKFPPHEARKPPTLNQWKRTEIGRRYADSTQSSRGRNTSVLREMLMSRLGAGVDAQVPGTRVQEKVSNTPNRLGMVEVDSGIEVMKIAYSSDIDERDEHSVNLDVTLKDLVVKVKRWPRYDSTLKERCYEVVRANGSIFTVYKGADLRKFTLGKLLEMMNFPKRGEVLKLRGGFIDIVRVEVDEYDTLSL